jgi:FlaA1/EpsC-like NDP-sugar epimerase
MVPSFRRDTLPKMVRVFNIGAVCVSFLATLAITSGSDSRPGFAEVFVARIKVSNLLLFVGYLALCSAIFSACGFYRSHRLSHWNQRLYEIFLSVTLLTGALLALRGIFRLSFATNGFLLLFWLSTFSILVLSHEIAHLFLHFARLRGRNLRNIIIVGEGSDATSLMSRIKQETSLGYRILRVIDAKELTENDRITGDI